MVKGKESASAAMERVVADLAAAAEQMERGSGEGGAGAATASASASASATVGASRRGRATDRAAATTVEDRA